MSRPITIQRVVDECRWAQRVVFGARREDMTPEQRANYVRSLSLGLIHEVGESLDETDWKPFPPGSPATGEVNDPEAFAEEMADVLIFWGNIAVMSGLDPAAFEAAFDAKMTKHWNRWMRERVLGQGITSVDEFRKAMLGAFQS